MIGIPLGLAYANVVESLFHRYVLHGLGKNPKSFWAFHWNEHHRDARRNAMRDDGYRRPLWQLNPHTKERLAIALGVAAHLPLAPIAPFFVATLAGCGVVFYRLHKRAHSEPGWARAHLPWHYDHHMGPDQDANWGIGLPWFDLLTGTRVPYAGTAREARDLARAALKKKIRAVHPVRAAPAVSAAS